MIKENITLYLYKGGASILQVDLSTFDFQGGTVVFTLKNMAKNTVFKTATLTENKIYNIVFTDETTKDLPVGSGAYKYDFMHHIQEERFPLCLPSQVIVENTVGGFQ